MEAAAARPRICVKERKSALRSSRKSGFSKFGSNGIAVNGSEWAGSPLSPEFPLIIATKRYTEPKEEAPKFFPEPIQILSVPYFNLLHNTF
jgi:hypothetical protein